VSHDLRTPLRAIDGFSHVLLDDCGERLSEECRDYLRRVRAASQRMAMLIDDLLKLATVTRAELVTGEVNLSRLAEEVIERLRNEEPQREVEVSITSDLRVHGDERLLRIVMENLLFNAWKFTANRRPARIEFRVAEMRDRPVFMVRDNGMGFDMIYADKLFAPFQRLHDQSEFAGTGIGLATVQRILRKHGGHIWARSAPGQGASFCFTI
jgi:signal transduction histidine kinase